MSALLREPARLCQTRHDLLIIGGGITGAALAWDAALRGLRVALVERADFGGATSQATSKLIHGGLRYLKNAELGLVRESLRERRLLQRIAPHLVWPLPFLIPCYPKGNTPGMIRAGMLLYDLLSFDRNRGMDAAHKMPSHRWLSSAAVMEAEPGVDGRALRGGAVYYDAQNQPERIVLELLLGAASLGAVIANYAELTSVEQRDGRVSAVEVTDRLSGTRHHVEASMVVNVAGPWADTIDRLFGTGEDIALLRSKGIHLVTRPISRTHALVLRTGAGRHFFVIPWRGMSLIGTTDTRYEGALDELAATDEDVQTFLDEINAALPSAELAPEDVRFRYAGVRPLVEQETEVYKASRKYEIVDHHRRGLRGLISAVGGKYTTSRSLAEKLTDRVLLHLDRPSVACLTEREPLPGARESAPLAALGLAADTLDHLQRTYGSRAQLVTDRVSREPALAERVAVGRPEILAEVAVAVEAEMAQTLSDVLLRRTGIGTLGHPGDQALARVSSLCARLLGWDEARTERERGMVLARLKGQPEKLC